MTGLHVVLGTGPLGLAVVRTLRDYGEQVRAVNRSGVASLPDVVTIARADLSENDQARSRVQM